MNADERKAYQEGLAIGQSKVKKAKLDELKKKGEADAEKPGFKEFIFNYAKKAVKEASKNV